MKHHPQLKREALAGYTKKHFPPEASQAMGLGPSHACALGDFKGEAGQGLEQPGVTAELSLL